MQLVSGRNEPIAPLAAARAFMADLAACLFNDVSRQRRNRVLRHRDEQTSTTCQFDLERSWFDLDAAFPSCDFKRHSGFNPSFPSNLRWNDKAACRIDGSFHAINSTMARSGARSTLLVAADGGITLRIAHREGDQEGNCDHQTEVVGKPTLVADGLKPERSRLGWSVKDGGRDGKRQTNSRGTNLGKGRRI